ncbi:MAG: hypothetical protein J7K87_00545 [Candidatus Aenigmarchaeota archaeon]|nr:hypothetical protein [Candidatus Aenigmarchaeota archaeon]
MKGQAAVEYMIIIGIAIAILTPLFVIIDSYTYESKQDLRTKALEDGLDSIAESANMVYFQGYPARISVTVYIPQGVILTNVTGDFIRVRLESKNGYNDVISVTDAPVNGTLPTSSGTYKVTVSATEDGWVNVSY